MKLYHGSTQQVKNPITERGRQSTDFGKGFYTTTNFEQAKQWALKRRKNADGDNNKAIVSVYETDDDLLKKESYDIRMFDAPDAEWLDFVVDCRRGKPHKHTIVFGPVADDNVYATIILYEGEVLNRETAIAALKIRKVFNQISFHTDKALSELRFIDAEEVF